MVLVQGWTTRPIGKNKSEHRNRSMGAWCMIKRLLKSVGEKVDCPMNNVGQLAADMVKTKITSLSYITHELNYSWITLPNYERPHFKAVRKDIYGNIYMVSVKKDFLNMVWKAVLAS